MAEIDISSKLGKTKQTIKIAEGKVFEVDTSADTYLVVQEKLEKENVGVTEIYEVIETLMGYEALKEIKAMKLSISGLKNIMIAVSALMNEVEYEEMEKRFR